MYTVWTELLPAPQSVHTCCLLCHREFKDWGSGLANGLPGHGSKLADAVPALSQALLREAPGRKLADAVPSLSQSLLGEVPLWICQSCRKSVEEEERRAVLEQSAPVSREGMNSGCLFLYARLLRNFCTKWSILVCLFTNSELILETLPMIPLSGVSKVCKFLERWTNSHLFC